jgi:predicted dienelactone hydrolase
MMRLLLAAGFVLLLSWCPAGAVGFQWATAPDPDDAALQVAIWYPSGDKTVDNQIGPFDMVVALNGAVSGSRHPLIVMSHGTGGMALNSYDTAIALAEAGFVVAAVTHTGDNYRDQSTAFTRQDFVDRARHVGRVIDFMLSAWAEHGSIDPARIGVFGHSAGGTTALIVAGGIADMNRVGTFCRTSTDDWGCQQARQRGPISETASAPVAGPDARIKAIVVAAPALAIAFQPAGLAAVKLPVQLWVGAQDEIIRDGSSIRSLLPKRPDYHLVAHGGHFAYLSPCSEILERAAPDICKNPKGFDRAAFLRAFHRSMIAFYRQHLR